MNDTDTQQNKKQKMAKGANSKGGAETMKETTPHATNSTMATTSGGQGTMATLSPEKKQEHFQALKKQMEDLQNSMQSLVQNPLLEGVNNQQGEGILRPFHSLGDSIGDRIFGPINANMNMIQQYVSDAQNMMKMAMDLVQKVEADEKKKSDTTLATTGGSTDLATTSSGHNQQITVHKVVPATKMIDQGSYVEAVVQVPFQNMEDIRFSYYSDNNTSYLTVRGRHHTNDKESEEFDVKFDLPQNTDVTRARANVHGQNLVVTVPKTRKRSRSMRDEDLSITPFNDTSNWMTRDPFFNRDWTRDWWGRDPWMTRDPFFDRPARSSIFGW